MKGKKEEKDEESRPYWTGKDFKELFGKKKWKKERKKAAWSEEDMRKFFMPRKKKKEVKVDGKDDAMEVREGARQVVDLVETEGTTDEEMRSAVRACMSGGVWSEKPTPRGRGGTC